MKSFYILILLVSSFGLSAQSKKNKKSIEDKFYYLAKYEEDSLIRIDAVRNLTDEKHLFSLARRSTSGLGVQIEAVKRIKNQKNLFFLAKYADAYEVKLIATQNLRDEDDLFYLVRRSDEKEIKEIAYSNLKEVKNGKVDKMQTIFN